MVKIKKTFSALLLMYYSCSFFYLTGFNNISELVTYAQQKDEFAKPDNNNFLKPDYSSFFKEESPGAIRRYINKILNKLFLKTKGWSAQNLKSLLIQETKKNEKKGYKGNFIFKIDPKPETQFVIWGDLQGAFHSLVRTLKKLEEFKIIDNELKIIRPNNYFIFNGNILSRSPYILETLTIILKLIEKNPDKIFYIRGDHESKGHWKNFGLKKELQFKAKHISNQIIPLEKEINDFINTLPLSFYINLGTKENTELIRISNYGRDYAILDESFFADFLTESINTTPKMFDLANKKSSNNGVSIKAIIKSQKRILTYEKTDGLQLLFPDNGAIAWSIFSSPTLASQKLYDFSNDAFTILRITSEKEGLLTLYRKNALEKKNFLKKTFNIISEELIEQDVEKKPAVEKKIEVEKKVPVGEKEETEKKITVEKKVSTKKKTPGMIRVGTTIDLSESSGIGHEVLAGIQLRINQANKSGGVNGKKFKFTPLNDKSEPALALENTKKLFEQFNTDILLVPMGSHTMKRYLSYTQDKNMLIAFPEATAIEFRKPELKNVVHFFPSAYQEGKAITDYLIKELFINKFALVYQTDSFSRSALKGAIESVKNNGLKENYDWIETSHPSNRIRIEKSVKEITKFNPKAIIFLCTAAPALAITKELGAKFLIKKVLAGISTFAGMEFKNKLKQRNLKIINTQQVPDINISNLEIVQDYRKEAKKKGKTLSPLTFATYMATSFFVHLLEKIESEITPEKIIQEAEKIKNYKFKGISLNFNPNTREIANNIWINHFEEKIVLYETKDDNKEEGIKPKLDEEQATIVKKITKNEKIRLGMTSDISADNSDVGMGVLSGTRLAIQQENLKGGIKNKKIELIHFDDKDDPIIAKKNVERLLSEFGIDILITPVGSRPFEGYISLIKDKKILAIFPEANSSSLHKSNLTNVINFFATSKQEAKALMEYLITQLTLTNFILVYQPEKFSKSALEGAKEILKKNNLKENEHWITTSHMPNSLEISKTAKDIKDFNPRTIVLLSTTTPVTALIRELGANFLIGKTLAGISTFSGAKFTNFLQNRNLKIINTQLVPNPKTSNIEIVKEYRQESKNNGKSLKSFSLEGYIATSLFLDILKKIDGEITKEKIIKYIENIKNEVFKGIKINFNPKKRALANNVWIKTSDGNVILSKQ